MLKGNRIQLYGEPVLHVRMPVWETKMDTLRAGGNCLIIHLVASMDIHYVTSPLRKTKEECLLSQRMWISHTQIIYVLGYTMVSIKSMATLKCQSFIVTLFLFPSLLYLCCPFCNVHGPLCVVNWGSRPLTRIAHFITSVGRHKHKT
jgi:hypothetical protein